MKIIFVTVASPWLIVQERKHLRMVLYQSLSNNQMHQTENVEINCAFGRTHSSLLLDGLGRLNSKLHMRTILELIWL